MMHGQKFRISSAAKVAAVMRTRPAGARHVVPSGPLSLPHYFTDPSRASLCSLYMANTSTAMICCPTNVIMARILAIVDWKNLTLFPPLETMLI